MFWFSSTNAFSNHFIWKYKSILAWIGNNKLATFLGVCLFCFIITTIAISTQKSSLATQLAECEVILFIYLHPINKFSVFWWFFLQAKVKNETQKPEKPETPNSTTIASTTTTKPSESPAPNPEGGEGPGAPGQASSASKTISNEDRFEFSRMAKQLFPILANAWKW